MISIRKAKKEDLRKISEIFRVEANKKPYSQKWTKKTALDDTIKSFKDEEIYIGILDKKIVGFIVSTIDSRKEAYVNELWVDSKYQKKGIGNTLLKYVEGKYKNEGIKFINLSVHKKSPAAKFYKKLNYRMKHETIRMYKIIE